jgi:hypothetical protein
MYYSSEQEKRIFAEQKILRSGKAADISLCRYKSVSCVRCCLPHIRGDTHIEDAGKKRTAPLRGGSLARHPEYSGKYLGPGGLLMKFKNFNPLKDPGIEASQYEDAFQDVGREEMEKRFAERRNLFIDLYDPRQPRRSLPQYMDAAQRNEGYRYKPAVSAGPGSLFLGGSVPTKYPQKGELPECQLLGFTDMKRTAGCLAHPLAETSQGYDGRDQVGFFHHTGCCGSVGCEASEEFRFLSPFALKIFDVAVAGLSWYEYSRHATSVLVYYLRSYDCLWRKLGERELLDTLTLDQLVAFTNSLYDEWPLRKQDQSEHHFPGEDPNSFNVPDILSTSIPLAERILYIALDTRFLRSRFADQLRQGRDHIEKRIKGLISGSRI